MMRCHYSGSCAMPRQGSQAEQKATELGKIDKSPLTATQSRQITPEAGCFKHSRRHWHSGQWCPFFQHKGKKKETIILPTLPSTVSACQCLILTCHMRLSAGNKVCTWNVKAIVYIQISIRP